MHNFVIWLLREKFLKELGQNIIAYALEHSKHSRINID